MHYFTLFFKEEFFNKSILFVLLLFFSKEFLVINEEFIVAISFLVLFYFIMKYSSYLIESELDNRTLEIISSYKSLIEIKYINKKKLLIIYVKKTKLFRSLRRLIDKFDDEVYCISIRRKFLSLEIFNRSIKSIIVSFFIKRNFKLTNIYNNYLDCISFSFKK